jgi:hypothetical protein
MSLNLLCGSPGGLGSVGEIRVWVFLTAEWSKDGLPVLTQFCGKVKPNDC